jgi:hypothetical protein
MRSCCTRLQRVIRPQSHPTATILTERLDTLTPKRGLPAPYAIIQFEMTAPPEQGTEQPPPPSKPSQSKRIGILIGVVSVAILLLVVILLAISAMVRNPEATETIRDVAIILLALEGFVIGLALTILIVQVARLTILLENEVKPILESTNETVNTLRGTTTFLSDNLAAPVIRANSVAAAVRRAFDLVRLGVRR